jgi:hypothetical protein
MPLPDLHSESEGYSNTTDEMMSGSKANILNAIISTLKANVKCFIGKSSFS